MRAGDEAAARDLFEHAQTLLKKIVSGKLIRARGVQAFWPAAADGEEGAFGFETMFLARARPGEELDVAAVRTVPAGAAAVPAAAAFEPALATEARQIAQVGVGDQRDVAAAAAVAAVGPALGHVGLAPERQRAVAAGAGADLQMGAVSEHS